MITNSNQQHSMPNRIMDLKKMRQSLTSIAESEAEVRQAGKGAAQDDR